MDALVRAGQGWALTLIQDAFIGFGQPTIASQVDDLYAIMDFYNYTDKVCVANGNSIEVAFGGPSGPPMFGSRVKSVEDSVFKRPSTRPTTIWPLAPIARCAGLADAGMPSVTVPVWRWSIASI